MKEVNKVEIGNKIRKFREKFSETQLDLAKLLDVKRQIISYYENGTRLPSLEHLIVIAAHYKTTVDYLIGLSNVPTTDKDIQFICNYTGLSEESVNILHNAKDNLYNIILYNFLVNNKILSNGLGQYLWSVVYKEYAKSDYKYLPLKHSTNFLCNPEIAQKVAYSNLLEILPTFREKMTDIIIKNTEIKEKLIFLLAKSVVDIGQCAVDLECKYCDVLTPEDEFLVDKYLSNVGVIDKTELEKVEERNERYFNISMEFLRAIHNKKGENNVNNP